eukprot:1365347-Rhodomonas_salina.2
MVLLMPAMRVESPTSLTMNEDPMLAAKTAVSLAKDGSEESPLERKQDRTGLMAVCTTVGLAISKNTTTVVKGSIGTVTVRFSVPELCTHWPLDPR